MKKYIPVLLMLFYMTACQTEKKEVRFEHKYFDLAGLVDRQLQELEASKPSIIKEVGIDSQQETVQGKDVNWLHELQLFKDADINKFTLRDSYQAQETDSVKRYVATDQAAKVQEMSIKGAKDNIREITIRYADHNQLYETQRTMTMKLQDNKLSGYTIRGFQKILLKDTLHYHLQAKVVR